MGEMPPILNIDQTKYHGVCSAIKKDVLAKPQEDPVFSSANFFDIQKIRHSEKKEKLTRIFPTTTHCKTYSTQSMYDAFSIVNQKEIDLISDLIIHIPHFVVFAPQQLLKLLKKDLTPRFSSIGVVTSFRHIDELDRCLTVKESSTFPVLFFVNINLNKFCNSSFWSTVKKNGIKTVTIGKKVQCNNSFDVYVDTCKPNMYNIKESDKVKVILNCLYLSIMSKKLTQQ